VRVGVKYLSTLAQCSLAENYRFHVVNWNRFYARQQYASCVLAMAYAYICLSVTPLICIKTVQDRITKFLLWAAPKTLVFCDKISCLCVRKF